VNSREINLLISIGIISEKGRNSFTAGRMSCCYMKMLQSCLVYELIIHILIFFLGSFMIITFLCD